MPHLPCPCLVLRHCLVLLAIGVCPCFAGAADPDLWDPEVGVLNHGAALDSRPVVSADRKYVTLGGQSARSVSLQGVFVERMYRSRMRRGGVRRWRPTATHVLAGTWTGVATIVAQEGKTAEEQTWTIIIDHGGGIAGKALHPIEDWRAQRYRPSDNSVRFLITRREPGGPIRQRTMLGRRTGGERDVPVGVVATLGDDLRRLQGTARWRTGKAHLDLRRQTPPMPPALHGTWHAATVDADGATVTTDVAPPIVLRLTSESASGAWGGPGQVRLFPIDAGSDSRRGVFLVQLDRGESRGRSARRGLMNVVLGNEGSVLHTYVSCAGLPRGYQRFVRAEDPHTDDANPHEDDDAAE